MVGNIPWRRKWQPTPVLLPEKSLGRGTWQAVVHGVAQSRTRVKRLSSSSSYIIWSVCVCVSCSSLAFDIRYCLNLFFLTCSVAQSWPTLCHSKDCSPPGSSIHGIFQGRILEWVAISFSRGSSRRRNRIRVSCIAGGLLHGSRFYQLSYQRGKPKSCKLSPGLSFPYL